MPELLLELFSEEIPARMQARGAADLARLVADALKPLAPADVRTFHGPRRLTLVATMAAATEAARISERGPRASAPEQALAGFLKKHNATRADVREEGGYFVLEKVTDSVPAARLIADALPGLLRRFPWPKSMRWGGASAFAWVRPLRRILCVLDGAIVPFDLRDGADDGHGLASGNETEGHRFHAPGAVAVKGFADYAAKLRERRVILDAEERKRIIADGIAGLAAEKGLTVVDDPGLLEEVAGLTEWPVPLLGRIEDRFMDLPPEVMQVSMRVNQRYFALRTADGNAAPWFAFAANVEAEDGGAEIARGNARVLSARFADARHFWDLDRKTTLESRLPKLDAVTFHAKLGTQGERARRIARLARLIAERIGADADRAERAGLLAKADLVSGMVGEFPELQGVMGGYYAVHDGEASDVAAAIRDHYAPKGAGDAVPGEPVSVAVALADKIDQLAGFFAVGEKPTGSGDPFALRRAALGVIRLVRENQVRLPLRPVIQEAYIWQGEDIVVAWSKLFFATFRAENPSETDLEHLQGKAISAVRSQLPTEDELALSLTDFIADRLRVQLRADGARHDILAAVFAAGADDDLVRVLARTDAVAAFVTTPVGADLLAAYKRAANILRIEDRKDGPHDGAPDPALFTEPSESALAGALDVAEPAARAALGGEDFPAAMTALAALRAPVDAFFNSVMVNAPEPELRRNRLRLLNRLRKAMDTVADFSQIEG